MHTTHPPFGAGWLPSTLLQPCRTLSCPSRDLCLLESPGSAVAREGTLREIEGSSVRVCPHRPSFKFSRELTNSPSPWGSRPLLLVSCWSLLVPLPFRSIPYLISCCPFVSRLFRSAGRTAVCNFDFHPPKMCSEMMLRGFRGRDPNWRRLPPRPRY